MLLLFLLTIKKRGSIKGLVFTKLKSSSSIDQIKRLLGWEEMRVEEGADINFLTLDGSSCPSGDIKVDILPPRPKALYIDRNSKISCVVSNLQNEQGLKFTWSREKSGHLTPDAIETTEGSNGGYIVLSRLGIFSEDWDSGETFTCVVEHPTFVSPVTKKISKSRGKEEVTLFSLMGTYRFIFICARNVCKEKAL